MNLVWNEFKKLISIKSVWVIYIIGMIMVGWLIKAQFSLGMISEFQLKFIETHGKGPYETKLITTYAELYNLLDECNQSDDYDHCINTQLNDEHKEILELYPNYSIELQDDRRVLNDPNYIYYHIGIFSHLNDDIRDINQEIEFYKLNNKFTGTTIEKYFLNKNNEKATEVLRNKVDDNSIYYMPSHLYSSFSLNWILSYTIIISSAMILLSIASSFSYDHTSNVDYLILTSKTGRKIIKRKLLAVTLASILYATILFVPVVILYIYHSELYHYLNIPINYLNSFVFYWFDITFLQMFILMYVLIVIAYIFIGLIASVIAIYSKKLLNIIIYTGILMTVIIVSVNQYQVHGANTIFHQIINIGLVHTPFGFLWENFDLLEFDTTSVNHSDFTYGTYPIVFVLGNAFIISLLCFLGIRRYCKENL